MYAIVLCVGFWSIVIGLLVGFRSDWWSGGSLIVLGMALITSAVWRSMDAPDPYEDEHTSSL